MEYTIYPKPTAVRQKSLNLGIHINKNKRPVPVRTCKPELSEGELQSLGLKAIFSVEEHTDKKKIFSEEWWLDPFTEEKLLGNIWKPKYLLLASTSISLFARTKPQTITSMSEFCCLNCSINSSDLKECKKLSTYINLKDVVSVHVLKETIVHVVQSTVSGKFSTLLNCTSLEESQIVMQSIKALKNALEKALSSLNKGLFDIHPNFSCSQLETEVGEREKSKVSKFFVTKVSLSSENCIDAELCLEDRSHFDFHFKSKKQSLNISLLSSHFQESQFIVSCQDLDTLLKQDAEEIMILKENNHNLELKLLVRRVSTQNLERNETLTMQLLTKFEAYDKSRSLKDISKGIITSVVVFNIFLLSDDYFTRGFVLFSLFVLIVSYYFVKSLFFILRMEAKKIRRALAVQNLCFNCRVIELTSVEEVGLVLSKPDPIDLITSFRQKKAKRRTRSIVVPSQSTATTTTEQTPRERASSERQDSNDTLSSPSNSFVIDDTGNKNLKLALEMPKTLESGEFDFNDNNIPVRWLEAVNFNRVEALSRWKQAIQWRLKNNISNALVEPQPEFDKIKSSFLHCAICTDFKGNLVTLEVLGNGKCFKDLKQLQVSPKVFGKYCIFLTEYWIKNNLAPSGKLVKIIDLKGISVLSFTPVVLSYLSELKDVFQNYPECLAAAYLVNVPQSFRVIWKILSRFIDKHTQKRFHILSNDMNYLQSLLAAEGSIDLSQIPQQYGGTREMSSSEYHNLSLEKEVKQYIESLNPEKKEELTFEDQTSTTNCKLITDFKGNWKIRHNKKSKTKLKADLIRQLGCMSKAQSNFMSLFEQFSFFQSIDTVKASKKKSQEIQIKLLTKTGFIKSSLVFPFYKDITSLRRVLKRKISFRSASSSMFSNRLLFIGCCLTSIPAFLIEEDNMLQRKCLLFVFKNDSHTQYIFHVLLNSNQKKVILSRYEQPKQAQCIILFSERL